MRLYTSKNVTARNVCTTESPLRGSALKLTTLALVWPLIRGQLIGSTSETSRPHFFTPPAPLVSSGGSRCKTRTNIRCALTMYCPRCSASPRTKQVRLSASWYPSPPPDHARRRRRWRPLLSTSRWRRPQNTSARRFLRFHREQQGARSRGEFRRPQHTHKRCPGGQVWLIVHLYLKFVRERSSHPLDLPTNAACGLMSPGLCGSFSTSYGRADGGRGGGAAAN
jgi:hypothetical protein